MAEHPDVRKIRRAIQARTTENCDPEDAALVQDLFADDVVWHDTASGKDGVLDAGRELAREGTSGKVGGVYADGLHTIATVEQALIFHLDGGKVTELWSLPTESAVVGALNLFHLDENGKAFEFWGVPADQEEMDAFWT